MQRITLQDLPKFDREKAMQILADMAEESPQTDDWHEIFNFLADNDYDFLRLILDEVQRRKKKQLQAKEAEKSEEERLKEQREWKEFIETADPKGFYGNMGEPTTPKEYKSKYGVWPPGYDENGNRIEQ